MLETFAALAEPNRFRIVELLREGPQSVNAIGESLGLNQPQVSKHLRVLKAARLVDVRPLAQQRLYGLRPDPLRELQTWLDGYRELLEERFDQLDTLLTEMSSASSPTPTQKDNRHGKRK
ncbi:MAG: winged helix-turn-helix transcriptional regulator [Polyangiaceae bacterium]|nr:winged helix-turn-helix transcriptional regulator [Myxococcales bacterium]MCB9586229.1 winged helix-turn-helix transcriptional regulator [Polyangiaceae bacterium]MCB9606906.1 winged helix-turn-helix transcriptional regulator [Polyangiaceae bacterium]